jgi:hypothetical protein
MTTEFLAVETIEETGISTQPGVSWAAIAAGAVAAAALSLLLVAFGAGLGLSAVSPWSDSGVSASTFSIGTGIYLCIVAVMSSAIGGYLAGRVRTKVTGLHTNEVFFRDTAHGFLAWAFATLISATALTSATAYLANGTLAGLSGLSSQSTRAIDRAQTYIDPAQTYVDKLFRTTTLAADNSAASNASNLQARAESCGFGNLIFAKVQNRATART